MNGVKIQQKFLQYAESIAWVGISNKIETYHCLCVPIK